MKINFLNLPLIVTEKQTLFCNIFSNISLRLEDTMRLSHYLIGFRKKNCLLQKEVADLLNISREHYAQIESGKLVPFIKLLRTISKKLRLDINIHVAHGGYSFLCKSEKIKS